MYVATYARISRDQEGRAEGVATQEAHARRYATEHWPDLPVVAFSDNDLSATNGHHRPGFEALLDAVRRGEVVHVVCAEQSRITREPAVWEAFMVTMAKAGIGELHTYRKGVVAIRGSKLVGRILSAVDAEESERIKARVKERHDALRAEGRPRGGLEYGYRPGRDSEGRPTLEVVPDEADVVRWAAEQLLSGWSLQAVARDLNARGVPTVRGKRWGTSTVSRMIRKPTIAGLRDEATTGTWEPILDERTWRDVRALLDSRKTTQTTARRKFLLTGGIAVCGRCGGHMGAQQRKKSSRGDMMSPRYFCRPERADEQPPATATDEWACQKVSIVADPLEDHVRDRLLDELDRPEFLEALAADEHEADRARIAGELRSVEVRRAELARLVAAGDMSTMEWREARGVLDTEQARLGAALAALPPPAVRLDVTEVRGAWEFMTLDEKRALLDMFVDRVVVRPADRPARRFDPGRISIEWRTS